MTLLEVFHEQIRLAGREDEPRPGMVVDRDGPVRRTWMDDPAGFAMVECPAGLGEDPDHWIDRQVEFFRGRGQELEWKTYDDDEPADLLDRLRDRGFEIGDDEALVLGRVADLVHPASPTLQDPKVLHSSRPATSQDPRVLQSSGQGRGGAKGVHLRRVEVDDDAAFAGIEALMEVVWGRRDGHTARLREELRAAPEGLDVLVAELDGQIVSAAWVRYSPGTDFCSFWGGSTHPDARGRGVYRALGAERARLAAARGFPFVRVDCSPESLPILTRLGLQRVATTVPATLPVVR